MQSEIVSTDSVEASEELVWAGELLVLPRAHEDFSAGVRQWEGGKLHLQEISIEISVRAQLQQTGDWARLFLAAGEGGSHVHDGLRLTAGQVTLGWSGLESYVWLDPASRYYLISFPASVARRLVPPRDCARSSENYVLLEPNGTALQRLRTVATAALLQSEEGGHGPRALEAELLNAVTDSIVEAKKISGSHAWIRHREALERFRQFLRDREPEQLHITEICDGIGVSQRTLRTCFENAFGFGPARFMRLRRHCLVRKSLREGGDITVTQVALDHGFQELGRFSVEYTKLFGESPSRTLRLHRQHNPVTTLRKTAVVPMRGLCNIPQNRHQGQVSAACPAAGGTPLF